jgi:FkbM family methyltransferase
MLDMSELGIDVRFFTTPSAALHLCVQQQYGYVRGGVACKIEEGDIAIDAGGCWGDSALYFATLVGDKGKVYCFEFIPANLAILRRNFALNRHLLSRIEVIERPLWERTGRTLYYLDRGPGSYVGWEKTSDQSVACETLAIDDLVREKNLPRVDFIKMDIEGAEVPALKGAENTLRAFKPKLAISAYHKDDDFESIPKYLESLDLGYRYYLDHHTIHLYETVLYAVADQQT